MHCAFLIFIQGIIALQKWESLGGDASF